MMKVRQKHFFGVGQDEFFLFFLSDTMMMMKHLFIYFDVAALDDEDLSSSVATLHRRVLQRCMYE
jgi:glutamate synthase domain-containing protein 1